MRLPPVILDIDGTLVTFKFDVAGTRAAMISRLSEMEYDTASLSLSTPTQSLMEEVEAQCAATGRAEEYPTVRSELFAILDRFEAESAAASTLLPGATEALVSLKATARLAVVTNSGRRAAAAVVSRWALGGYFEFVLTRDDVGAMKPRPAGIRRALQLFSASAESAYYVGDSVFDVQAARAAGVMAVAVATGSYSADRLRSEGADYVLTGIDEVPGLLKRVVG
jgi:phosphoglycolate phosphatase